MSTKRISRREMLKGLGLAMGSTVLASCAPKIVKETVIVEKVVEKPIEKVVKETVLVQGTPQVVEKVVTATPVDEQVTLKVPVQAGFDHQYPAMLAAFKSKYPNVTVEESKALLFAEDEIRFLAEAAAGIIDDVLSMGDEHPSFYGPRGIVVNLSPYMEADKAFWLNDELLYLEAFNTEANGARYSVPTTDNPWATLLNLQNFDDLGVEVPPFLYGDPDYWDKWSWEGLKETARQLTLDTNGKHPGETGFDKDNVEKWGLAIDLNWQQLWPIIYQAGGKAVDDEQTKVLFDSPESLKAMTFVAEMIEEGMCLTPGLAGTLGGAVSLFESGITAMIINGTWTYNKFREDVQAGKLRLAYAPLAHDVTTATVELGVQWGIATQSKYKDLAWAWIKEWYLHGDAAMEEIAKMGHNPWVLGHPLKKQWREFLSSGRATVLQDYGIDHIDLRPIYEDSLSAKINPMPYGPWFPEVRDIFYAEMGPALNLETTVEDAVAAMLPQQQEVMTRWYEIVHG